MCPPLRQGLGLCFLVRPASFFKELASKREADSIQAITPRFHDQGKHRGYGDHGRLRCAQDTVVTQKEIGAAWEGGQSRVLEDKERFFRQTDLKGAEHTGARMGKPA